jgi:hypothetical protein
MPISPGFGEQIGSALLVKPPQFTEIGSERGRKDGRYNDVLDFGSHLSASEYPTERSRRVSERGTGDPWGSTDRKTKDLTRSG